MVMEAHEYVLPQRLLRQFNAAGDECRAGRRDLGA